MDFRVHKALTALLIISAVCFLGSCKAIPAHTAGTPHIQPSDSSDTVTSEQEQSFGADSSEVVSSESESTVPNSSEPVSSVPETGNQVIVDTGEDVGAMDDPEDPMKPNHNVEDEPEKPADTIVLPIAPPPSVSSQPSSSSAISSEVSSQPPVSSATSSEASSQPPVSSATSSEPSSQPPTSSETSSEASSQPPVSSATSSEASSQPSSSSETSSEGSSQPPTSSETSSEASSQPPVSSETSSEVSSQPPTSSEETPPPFAPPETGWYDYEGSRYLYLGGQPVSGYQSVNGLGYYFEADGKLASKVGIDVSKYQNGGTGSGGTALPIDWAQVKAAGVDYAIIRIGYRGYGNAGNMAKDPKFLENITNATNVGIDCGIYFFSQAITEEEAREEAQAAVKWLEESGKKLTYPIYFDTEESTEGSGNGRADKLTVQQRTNVAKAFCEEIKRLGYYPGIYASTSWLNDQLDMSQLSEYDVWVAHYRSDITEGPGYTDNMTMWQYTSKGTIPGIFGEVDCNIGLVDYPALLRQNGYNKLTEHSAQVPNENQPISSDAQSDVQNDIQSDIQGSEQASSDEAV